MPRYRCYTSEARSYTFKLETDAASSQPHQPAGKSNVMCVGWDMLLPSVSTKLGCVESTIGKLSNLTPLLTQYKGSPNVGSVSISLTPGSHLRRTSRSTTQTPWMKARLQAMSGAAVSAPTAALLQSRQRQLARHRRILSSNLCAELKEGDLITQKHHMEEIFTTAMCSTVTL